MSLLCGARDALQKFTTRKKRNRGIVAARLRHGYSFAEIGRQTGLHYRWCARSARLSPRQVGSKLAIHGLTLGLHTGLYQAAELPHHRLLSSSSERGTLRLPQEALSCSGWVATA